MFCSACRHFMGLLLMIDEIFYKKINMLRGFKFKKWALHWIWVLCVSVHITSCEGGLHRDDIRGIEFFPLMNKGRSDIHQNQVVVGKKIDLEEVKKWFDGLLGLVNRYRDELKSIRGIVDNYKDDSGKKLDGLRYKEQRIALPFLGGAAPVDLLVIIGGDLFSGESGIRREIGKEVPIQTLCFKFLSRATGSTPNNDGVDLKLSTCESFKGYASSASSVRIEMDQANYTIGYEVQRILTFLVRNHMNAMADEIVGGEHRQISTSMKQICDEYGNNWNNDGDFQAFFGDNKRRELAGECGFDTNNQVNESDIFNCKQPLGFVAFEPVDKCIGHAESIGKSIEIFSKKLDDQIHEKRKKSKNDRVFMAHDDFQKQYGQDIIDVLTSVKSLFGKTSSSIGSTTLGYGKDISKCFGDICKAMKGYDEHQLALLRYMTYSVLFHAKELIGGKTFQPNFKEGDFNGKLRCVNVGINNTLNMIHVLCACKKMLQLFSNDNVQKYIDSLKQRYIIPISIADMVDRLGVTSAKDLTISGMNEIFGIKIWSGRG